MLGRGARTGCAALALCLLAWLGLAGIATAEPLGDFARFKQCPWAGAGVERCFFSTTDKGLIALGSKKIPIGKPILLQGGLSAPVGGFAKFSAAKTGLTLNKAPQAVPGGLAGLLPDASSPPLVKSLALFFFSNGLTGVNATVELAKPASSIEFSEENLLEEEGVALKLPVKIRLENPFFSKRCYIGSEAAPLEWQLTTGETSPSPPNKPLSGAAGTASFLGGGEILHQEEAKLVDNAWQAPGANGCGGIIAFLVDPVVNAQLGSLTAGHNTAILDSAIDTAEAEAVELCSLTDCS